MKATFTIVVDDLDEDPDWLVNLARELEFDDFDPSDTNRVGSLLFEAASQNAGRLFRELACDVEEVNVE